MFWVFTTFSGQLFLLVLVFGVVGRVLIRLVGLLDRCRGLLLSGFDVQLASLEVRFVKLSESLNGSLTCCEPDETKPKRHTFTMLAEWNLNVDNLTVLAE